MTTKSRTEEKETQNNNVQITDSLYCLKCQKELHVKMIDDLATAEFRESIKKYLLINNDPSLKDFYLRKCIKWVAYCECCDWFYEWKNEHPFVANMKVFWNGGKTKYDKAVECTLEEIKPL